MKKISIAFLLAITPLTVEAATCAGGKGTIVTGRDGTEYCQSNMGVNWWSANAWCDAIGKKLIDLQVECDKVTGETECPNFEGITTPFPNRFWTRNIYSIWGAYVVYGGGDVDNCVKFKCSDAVIPAALCK